MSDGWIYFVQTTNRSKRSRVINSVGRPNTIGRIKIGFTGEDLHRRLRREFRSDRLTVLFLGAFRGTLKYRNALRALFSEYRVRVGNHGTVSWLKPGGDLLGYIRALPRIKPLPPIVAKPVRRARRCTSCGQKLTSKGRV